ncbi:MAG TPA: hypothetical protein VMW16_06340 [Sedimentisphaerales bacterium]|nr:hypothetical protein [Sedimentisphaerales bacterium]
MNNCNNFRQHTAERFFRMLQKVLQQERRNYVVSVEITRAIVLIMAVSRFCAFGACDVGRTDRIPYSLPWELIAEKVREGAWFCENRDLFDSSVGIKVGDRGGRLDPNWCYVHPPKKNIAIEFPAGMAKSRSLQETDFRIAKWEKNSWKQAGQASAEVEPESIGLVDGIKEDGLFRLEFSLKTQAGGLSDFETYAIVCGDWKKDLLAFCYEQKAAVEYSTDPELIFSSIVVSHFNRTMLLISEAPFLSGEILKALADAVRSKVVYGLGGCPEPAIGLSELRLRRYPGGPVARFTLLVPPGYDASRKWPVFVLAGNRAESFGASKDIIYLRWSSISSAELQWQEYKTIFGIMKEKLNIDQDRVYINGECSDGIMVMSLALHYPDEWAGASASTGNSFRHLAGNALNLPFFFCNMHRESDVMVAYCDFAAKCFEHYGCKHFRYSKTETTAQPLRAPVPSWVRESNPQRVLYTIESLENPRAYWAQIDGRTDENLAATIDASVEGRFISVTTNNVDAYTLDLVQAPLDSNIPVEIVENGSSLGVVRGEAFTKRPEAYSSARHVKNQRLHGPVWDVFTDPYVVVWGAGSEDRRFCETSEAIAKSLANGAPCFADADMPAKLIDSHNLVLVGTPESNLWLSKICEDLPVQRGEGLIIANGRRYEGDGMGFILIYPNPINPQKYAAVFFSTSSTVMVKILQAFSQMKSPMMADVGIFEVTAEDEIKWHIIEAFNTVWGWHQQWDRVLGVTKKEHPKWCWGQWAVTAIKEELQAEIAVCENPFKFSDSVPAGRITYRDLFSSFKNHWIVKVKLDGKSLKNLLLVPFRDITKRKVVAPIISGASLLKPEGSLDDGSLALNELEDERTYIVALSYKLINGQQLGVIFEDYEILDVAYLVPLLDRYLTNNSHIELDSQLDSLSRCIL